MIIVDAGDPAADMKRFVEHNALTSPFLIDSPTEEKDGRATAWKVYEQYHAHYGTQYFIDGKGQIIEAHSKEDFNEVMLRARLAELGVGKPPTSSSIQR